MFSKITCFVALLATVEAVKMSANVNTFEFNSSASHLAQLASTISSVADSFGEMAENINKNIQQEEYLSQLASKQENI